MEFTINTPSGRSVIYCRKAWKEVSDLLPKEGVVIVTDENVFRLYGRDFPDFPVLVTSPGESSKQLSTIDELVKKLIELDTDRTGFILAIGGGVVCDISGFLAAVYMRGIKSGFVSTTLLSQVDASVGGKNGVNSGTAKNMIGTFTQPDFVICDPSLLSTLPDSEYISGLAELIKTAVILDAGMFSEIEANIGKILNRDNELLQKLISRAVELKAMVVQNDEKESGLRRILNFGHTFGHAIEISSGFKHGFAVAAGMEIAAGMSAASGLLAENDLRRLKGVLEKAGLLLKWNTSENTLKKMISADKKNEGSAGLNFVFINGIGSSTVKKHSVDELMELFRRRTII
jgi:3-dehydroquinate synthase